MVVQHFQDPYSLWEAAVLDPGGTGFWASYPNASPLGMTAALSKTT